MEIKGNFINYGNFVDVHDNETVNISIDKADELKVEERRMRFPACLNYAQGEQTLGFLKTQSFVAAATDPSNFLYQMGCSGERPKTVVPLVWLKNKQLLRELLELWFAPLIADGALKKARLEAICSQVFVDEDGEMILLAKNKAVPSVDSDDLAQYFATIVRPDTQG